MEWLKIKSSISDSPVDGYYKPTGAFIDKEAGTKLAWESDTGLRLEADDASLQYARIFRPGVTARSVIAERLTAKWIVWNGSTWETDNDFLVFRYMRTALQGKLPVVTYDQGSTVLFLAFSIRPVLIEESIAEALNLHPSQVVVLRASNTVPYFVFLEIVEGPKVSAKESVYQFIRQCCSRDSYLWTTALGQKLTENGNGLLEVVSMPNGANPAPVTNVVAEIRSESIELSWDPPRGDGGHRIESYGVQVIDQPGYVVRTTSTTCSIPRSTIEPLLPTCLNFPVVVTATNAKGDSELAFARLVVSDASTWEFGRLRERRKRVLASVRDEIIKSRRGSRSGKALPTLSDLEMAPSVSKAMEAEMRKENIGAEEEIGTFTPAPGRRLRSGKTPLSERFPSTTDLVWNGSACVAGMRPFPVPRCASDGRRSPSPNASDILRVVARPAVSSSVDADGVGVRLVRNDTVRNMCENTNADWQCMESEDDDDILATVTPGTRAMDADGWLCKVDSIDGDVVSLKYDDGSATSRPLSTIQPVELQHTSAECIQRAIRRHLEKISQISVI